MFIRFLCVFVMICISSFLNAEIRECSTMSELLQDTRPNTLYIFDIDNTLFRPSQMLGSDEWVEYCLKKKEAEGLSSDEARKSFIETGIAVQVLTKIRLIEEETPGIIAKLQEQGFPIMILTSRGEVVMQTTQLQVASTSIDMSKSPVSKENFPLKEFPQVKFVNGILFASGHDKGKVLISFLHQIGFTPKRIVFIDDKASNLTSMACVEQEGIEFLGLRYNRADSIVQSFDALLADIELEHLRNSILSDEEARALR